jgi:nucleoside-diphosphate-sugar epimerase
MRVFVTGGYGFLGTYVLKHLLDEGHDVCSFDIASESDADPDLDVTDVQGDITDPVEVYDAMCQFDPDRVVHLVSVLSAACQSDPRAGFDVNVNGTMNVLEAASTLGVERVVAASSVAVYGSIPDRYDHLDESVPHNPQSIYGLTKYNIERLGETYAAQNEFSYAAMEPVYTTGPDRRTGYTPVAYVLKAAVSGTPVTIPASTKPLEVNYVADTARAFVDTTTVPALDHSRYLVGSGQQTSFVDLVDLVRERVPDAAITLEEGVGEELVPSLPPSDASRLRAECDWSGRSVADAVDAYVEWLEANEGRWEFDPQADTIA